MLPSRRVTTRFKVGHDGQKVAEPPHPALVDWHCRGATLLPQPSEGAGVWQAGNLRTCHRLPSWTPGIGHLEESTTKHTAEVAGNRAGVGHRSTFCAS